MNKIYIDVRHAYHCTKQKGKVWGEAYVLLKALGAKEKRHPIYMHALSISHVLKENKAQSQN